MPLHAPTMYHRVPMSGKAVGHGGPVFWARVSEGRMGQGGTYFGQGCQKAVWDKGVRYFTRGLQPGTPGSPPGSPGTFRSTPAGNTCSPRDRGAWGTGASGNVKNCFKGRKIIFHFRKKYFSRKNLLGRGYFGEKMCPRFPVYPGWPFLCRLAPGKEKKYRRGYRRSKNWAIIFPGTPGTLSVVNVALFFRKNIAWVFGAKNPGAMWYPGFPENIRCMCVTKPGLSYILVNLNLQYFTVCCVTKLTIIM